MMGLSGYRMTNEETDLLINQIDKEDKGSVSLKEYEQYTLDSLKRVL